MNDLATRRLYLCTPLRRDLTDFVTACIRGGVDIVQLREKNAPDRAILAAARDLSKLCARMGTPFFINDRCDIALASDAHGVHVGRDDLPVSEVRNLIGRDRLIGTSTHSRSDFAAARLEEVDYISTGPVEATPTKPGREGTGLSFLQEARATRDPRPQFITGGIRPEVIDNLWANGARHFVVVRYLTTSTNPQEAARQLRSAISVARSRVN